MMSALCLAVAASIPSRSVLAAHDGGAQAPPPPSAEEPAPPVQPPAPAFLPAGIYFTAAGHLGVAPNFATDLDFEVGADVVEAFDFAAGYRASILRLEAAFGFQNVAVSSLKLGPASPFPVDDYAGGVFTADMMANVYLEAPFALFGRVRPYVGAGHGYSWVSARYTPQDCYLGVCSPDGSDVVSASDFVRSRQLMAGVTIASDTPNTEIVLGYRHFESRDLKLRTEGGLFFTQDGVETFSLFFGARFRFGAPR